ncbi:hypothetical protein OB955_16555 [Halobacteria archaeon AArc-m2/3/4]|uniref:Uncharacterized protein n=1 Tax=Natronoglomus mannanivorans TaxID=2979990 RepID=A0AAP2Z2S0_9EURY|nr:hypothetical protein [Halobacteria archaeon AArc-xg1-1]MCU4974338.1 hypothetical protein [Halobacteria archaeon AArc-m2/3/4]
MFEEVDRSSSSVSEGVLLAIEVLSVLPIVLSAGLIVFLSLDAGIWPPDRELFIFHILVWVAIGAIPMLVFGGVTMVRYVLDGPPVSQLVVGLLVVCLVGFLVVTLSTQGGFDQTTAQRLLFAGGIPFIGSSVAITIHVLIRAVRTVSAL